MTSPSSRLGCLAASIALLLPALAACGRSTPPAPPAGPLVGAAGEEDVLLDDGVTRRRTVLTRAYRLSPWRVAVHAEPFRIEPLASDEAMWVLRWTSNTEDVEGRREPDDIHCHATLSDGIISSDHGDFLGIYTDGFTPQFALPEGFGVRVPAGRPLLFQPMFNNRRPEGRLSRMRLELDYVGEEVARERGLTALRGFAVSVVQPELYWVEPFATDEKERTFEMPVTGRIHAIGAHLHPQGEEVTLVREEDGKVVFQTRMEHAEDLGEFRLPTWRSAEGLYVRAGDRYRLTTTYVNTTEERVDAMGGVFCFYDPEGEPDV